MSAIQFAVVATVSWPNCELLILFSWEAPAFAVHVSRRISLGSALHCIFPTLVGCVCAPLFSSLQYTQHIHMYVDSHRASIYIWPYYVA